MRSCFSDMADKKRKIANSFRNTRYETKLSEVVKSIENWVMDDLSMKKKMAGFLCNDMAQIIRKICGISKRQIFNI